MLQYQRVLVIAPKMNIGAVLNQLSRAKFNAEHAVQYEWDKHRFCIDSGISFFPPTSFRHAIMF